MSGFSFNTTHVTNSPPVQLKSLYHNILYKFPFSIIYVLADLRLVANFDFFLCLFSTYFRVNPNGNQFVLVSFPVLTVVSRPETLTASLSVPRYFKASEMQEMIQQCWIITVQEVHEQLYNISYICSASSIS